MCNICNTDEEGLSLSLSLPLCFSYFVSLPPSLSTSPSIYASQRLVFMPSNHVHGISSGSFWEKGWCMKLWNTSLHVCKNAKDPEYPDPSLSVSHTHRHTQTHTHTDTHRDTHSFLHLYLPLTLKPRVNPQSSTMSPLGINVPHNAVNFHAHTHQQGRMLISSLYIFCQLHNSLQWVTPLEKQLWVRQRQGVWGQRCHWDKSHLASVQIR